MINWDSITYSVDQASSDFNTIQIKSNSIEPIKLNDNFTSLRNKLIEARNYIFDKFQFDTKNKLDYQFDLLFGLEIYSILNQDSNFSNRVANNDDMWRYLSVKVIPDIVHSRWGLNEAHFYKMPRRIWLKTIWWYIHLSWYKNKSETYDILKDNSTDTILQLVERPSLGYYIDLYREIMYQYYKTGNSDRDLFRRVLKLNTARIVSTSPELLDGGLVIYVAKLFEDAKVK